MKTLDLQKLVTDILSIQQNYEGFVRSAPNDVLVSLAYRTYEPDTDYEVSVVLATMAKAELARRD